MKSDKLAARLDKQASGLGAGEESAVFWDVFGAGRATGARHRLRHGAAAVLAPAQLKRRAGGVLQLVFKIADDNGLLLLDLKDLRAMVQFVGDNAKSSPPNTATSPLRPSAPSSAAC